LISSFSIKSVDGKVIFHGSVEILIRKSFVFNIMVTDVSWFVQGVP